MTELKNISELKLWDKNPRGIKKDDFARLKNQIKELGLYKPFIITEDGVVLGGNMRLRACLELGIEDVEVSIVNAPDDATKLKYALSDNDRAGYYEEDQLAELVLSIPDLDLSDYKLDLGKLTDIDDLLSQFAPDVVEDEVPEEVESVAKLGDVWQLGRHRLMCGDSTKIEDVETLMDGRKADMVCCEPPYGMKLDTDWSDVRGSKYSKVIGDEKEFDIKPYLEYFKEIKEQFWWGADYYARSLPYNVGSWLVWDKRSEEGFESNGNPDAMIGSMFEMCWSRNKHRREILRFRWAGSYGLWQDDTEGRVHPTQKPALMMGKIVSKYGKDNDVVVDLFLGSGSTLIACEQTNRICYGMEIDPHYCDVVIARYEKFTETKAKKKV